MANDNARLTQAGYDRLQVELGKLKEQRVITIAEVKAARELGDLKENGDYHAAREAYGWLEGRIQALEAKLDGAQIVADGEIDERVDLGVPITVRNEQTGEKLHYTIVDGAEVAFYDNAISADSPIGEAMLGLKVNEVAEVETPRGFIPYTILQLGE